MEDGTVRVHRAQITLPDYFESLTQLEGRTVMLTPIVGTCEQCGEFLSPSLGSSKVSKGKFTVYGLAGYDHPDAEFYWEVKAVRKDVEQFEVEPNKTDYTLNGDGPYTYLTKTPA